MPTPGSPASSLGHGPHSLAPPMPTERGCSWQREYSERAQAMSELYPTGTPSGTRQLLGEKATPKVPASCTPLWFPRKASCTFWGPPGALTVYDVYGTDSDSRCWRADCMHRVSDLPSLPPLLRRAPEVTGRSERGPVVFPWGSCWGLSKTLAVTPSQDLGSWPFGTSWGSGDGARLLNAQSVMHGLECAQTPADP